MEKGTKVLVIEMCNEGCQHWHSEGGGLQHTRVNVYLDVTRLCLVVLSLYSLYCLYLGI